MQRPSISRDVHYVAHGTPIREDGTQAFPSVCRAAKVTEVDPSDPGRVGVVVFNPSGEFFHPLASGGCVQDEAGHGRYVALAGAGRIALLS